MPTTTNADADASLLLAAAALHGVDPLDVDSTPNETQAVASFAVALLERTGLPRRASEWEVRLAKEAEAKAEREAALTEDDGRGDGSEDARAFAENATEDDEPPPEDEDEDVLDEMEPSSEEDAAATPTTARVKVPRAVRWEPTRHAVDGLARVMAAHPPSAAKAPSFLWTLTPFACECALVDAHLPNATLRAIVKEASRATLTTTGFTPAHVWAHDGRVDLLSEWLRLGGDVTTRSSAASKTPLDIAIDRDNDHVVELLRSLASSPITRT